MFKQKIVYREGKKYVYTKTSYGNISSRSQIVGKKGINQDKYNAMLEILEASGATKFDIAEFKAEVKYKASRKDPKDRILRASWVRSRHSTNKREKMFINSGYSAEELADEIGVTAEQLLDEENWNGDYFSVNGMGWLYTFKYNNIGQFKRTR